MCSRCIPYVLACVLGSATPCERAWAGVIEFWNDQVGWKTAVQKHNFTDFTEFTHGTVITDQIPGLTITTFAFIHSAGGYSDGYGLLGNNGIRIEFDTPHHAVAVDHLGSITFALYYKGELVEIAPTYCNIGCPFPGVFAYPGAGAKFSGIISESPFDEVYFFRPQPPEPNNIASLDSLYWGMPVPAPGALPLLALALFASSRRRRGLP